MKIVVPIKRVFDPYAKVRPTADGLGLDTGGAKWEINPFDEIALEEAVRLREKLGDVEIVALSVGEGGAEEQLRKALAMGADRAVLVETGDVLDSSVVAKELEAVVREEAPDLVLMGKQGTDADAGQAAQILAARLGWPHVSYLAKLDMSAGQATCVRETDQGEETVRTALPAVLTTDLRLNEPRYIALPAIIKARSKPLARKARATSATPKVRTVRYDAPPPRPAGRKVGSVDELVAAIQARGSV